jgi:hypothetical protein
MNEKSCSKRALFIPEDVKVGKSKRGQFMKWLIAALLRALSEVAVTDRG